MYSTSKKANYRNRSTSYFQKGGNSNLRTFSRVKALQDNKAVQQSPKPLFVSASSWIVVTPNALKLTPNGVKVNIKYSAPTPKPARTNRITRDGEYYLRNSGCRLLNKS